jgi:hypothetical protein
VRFRVEKPGRYRAVVIAKKNGEKLRKRTKAV